MATHEYRDEEWMQKGWGCEHKGPAARLTQQRAARGGVRVAGGHSQLKKWVGSAYTVPCAYGMRV